MKQSACSAVICQPGGREQKHDISISILHFSDYLRNKAFSNLYE